MGCDYDVFCARTGKANGRIMSGNSCNQESVYHGLSRLLNINRVDEDFMMIALTAIQ
jgi:hypothetical protein